MYKTTIGLEVHVELNTKSKMFCSCLNDSDEEMPNKNVCPICLGHPGTLPVINEKAVEKLIKAGIALNCSISKETKFDRKNYFYPDLAKGYQVSQYDKPICKKGFLDIGGKVIKIKRIHLEEDTGKLFHPSGENYSLIDFNRSSVPLMELVTEPEIENAEDARKFAEELQLILRYLDVSDADMEKGQMRVEVNISVSKDESMGTRVEIKNLNSFKSVEKAALYEEKRHAKEIEKGEKIKQETRGWDEIKQKTVRQRSKEQAHDYRYFPEPDLPMLYFSDQAIQEIKKSIPELPDQKRKRFEKEFFLDEKTIENFVRNKELGNYFEKVISELKNWIKEIDSKKDVDVEELKQLIKTASNYIITDFQGMLDSKPIAETLITPENFAELMTMIYKDEISSKVAKKVLKKMIETGADPSNIVQEGDLSQIDDEKEIEKIVKLVLEKNPKAVEDYKKGNIKALQFLAGQVLAESSGKANPNTVQRLLEQNLE